MTPVFAGSAPCRTTAGLVRFTLGARTSWHRPPGEEHWHGATADTFMSHVVLLEAEVDGSEPTTWLEPVTDEQYAAAHRHH